MKHDRTQSLPSVPHAIAGIVLRFTTLLPKLALCAMLGVVATGLSSVSTVQAGLTATGGVTPDTNPSGWVSTTRPDIGSWQGPDGYLTVDGGSVLNTWFSRIGTASGYTGTVTVTGANSKWATSQYLYIGDNGGTGKLIVTEGGYVSSGGRHGGGIMAFSGTAMAIVNGAGSQWVNNTALEIGRSGSAKLTIANGGAVTSQATKINDVSTLTIDVGKGSSLTVNGTGSTFSDSSGVTYTAGRISNEGTIRLVAGATAANGAYTPITAYEWVGLGTVEALGGVWDPTAHTVTVSGAAAASGIGGATAAFNLASNQRVIITDSISGYSVGAGFLTGTADVTFTAASLTPTALAALQSLLASGNTIASAWSFSTTGATVGDANPVYLSLYAGPNQSLSTLGIWHYDGSTWSAFMANDLAYDGTYASFTVTGFSGYAVSGTAPVPVPAAVWLLGSGFLGLMGVRRRIGKSS